MHLDRKSMGLVLSAGVVLSAVAVGITYSSRAGAQGAPAAIVVHSKPHVEPQVTPYVTPTDPPTGAYTALTPARILDTRNGIGGPTAPVAAGSVRAFEVAGQGGVAATGVTAVVLNVTVTQPDAAGYITAYADGSARPTASNVNFVANQTVPNTIIAPVGGDGEVDLYNGSGGSVQLIADVSGYFAPGSVSYVTAVTNSQFLWNSSYVFDTSSSGYTEYFTRYYDFSVPALSQNILNKGTVQVFFTPDPDNNTNSWQSLPYSFTDASNTFSYNFVYTTSVGQVELGIFFIQFPSAPSIPTLSTYAFPTYKFKVVVTPGA